MRLTYTSNIHTRLTWAMVSSPGTLGRAVEVLAESEWATGLGERVGAAIRALRDVLFLPVDFSSAERTEGVQMTSTETIPSDSKKASAACRKTGVKAWRFERVVMANHLYGMEETPSTDGGDAVGTSERGAESSAEHMEAAADYFEGEDKRVVPPPRLEEGVEW